MESKVTISTDRFNYEQEECPAVSDYCGIKHVQWEGTEVEDIFL